MCKQCDALKGEFLFQSPVFRGLFLLPYAHVSFCPSQSGRHEYTELNTGFCTFYIRPPERENTALLKPEKRLHAVILLIFAVKEYAKHVNGKRLKKMINTDPEALNRKSLFSLKAFVKARGIKNVTDEKNMIQQDISFLRWLKIDDEGRSFFICDSVNFEEKTGYITFEFSYDFIERAFKYLMPFPSLFWRLNLHKNLYAPSFLFCICQSLKMNAGKDRALSIGINELIRCSGLVLKVDNSVQQGNQKTRIIKPFERDLNALYDVFSWKYKEPFKGFKEWQNSTILLTAIHDRALLHMVKAKKPLKRKAPS